MTSADIVEPPATDQGADDVITTGTDHAHRFDPIVAALAQVV